MIEAQAVVVRIEGDRAWVKLTERPGGCGRCDEPGGCRSAKIAHALKAPTEVFSLPNPEGIEPGAAVRIRMADGGPLRGALASYGLGACLLVVGAAAGHFAAPAGQSDLFALAGAASGLAGVWGVNRILARSGCWREALEMTMVRESAPCALQREASA